MTLILPMSIQQVKSRGDVNLSRPFVLDQGSEYGVFLSVGFYIQCVHIRLLAGRRLPRYTRYNEVFALLGHADGHPSFDFSSFLPILLFIFVGQYNG